MGIVNMQFNLCKNKINNCKRTLIRNSKPEIHPKFFPEAQVFCGGEVVMTVGGTQEKYVVDIWSGNHPFFQGAGNIVVADEGQVNRFKKRFAGLDKLSAIQNVSGQK